jgi:hypothetical protein
MDYLISATNTYRVHTVAEVEALHEQLKNDDRFTLNSFSYTTKDIKEKRQVVDQYQLVKAKLTFTAEKEPDRFFEVEYNEI